MELTKDLDVFRYRNYYNGGGVAIGDINNDNLPDVYLSANMQSNRLFINKGGFRFEDITESSGTGGSKEWSTGVSMADVNGDGLLDIYVCNSGDVKGGKRENELFINNGDLTFTEKAEEYGLADKGFSTHAVFFDFDQDGDLDCYVLNNSFRPVSSLGLENIRHVRDSTGGDKLYRNDNGKFVDISQQAGINGSVIGFGLGVTITDANLDGWMDLYISNDFFERDYLYINQRDGTFQDELPSRIDHISQFSMGTDAADLNNDGAPDIFVTDMLPATDERLKSTTNFENYDKHQLMLANDYYEQFMRNTLQLNNGRGGFVEVGQYAGVHATDWSWGTLIADFDNDSRKEVFVTNGVYRDVTDQDFIDFLASEENLVTAMRQETVDFEKLVEKMPSNPISNYMFKSDSLLHFEDVAEDWGLSVPSHSNGAAYGDLDNDGDLDLIVNNVNQELFVYRNNANETNSRNYLKVRFKGEKGNVFGVGARVEIYHDNIRQMLENVPTKGFQSSMNYEALFGVGSATSIDSVIVYWGQGKRQLMINVPANQQITLDVADARPFGKDSTQRKSLFSQVNVDLTPKYKHIENGYVDFDRERLIYHMLSKEGPALAVGDVNRDSLDDFYIGGALGQAGRLYIQNRQGGFSAANIPAFEKDKNSEDVDAILFDANGDGKLDLYVVSGGYEFREHSMELQDRLYLQKGDGRNITYEKSTEGLPRLYDMGSCVRVGDYDSDGDLDLFIGGRATPGNYGSAGSSRILQNDGTGKFDDATARVAPRLANLGMVTAGAWVDIDNDNDLDLVAVGEWLPLTIFKNNGANLERLSNVPGLANSNGWYQSVIASDVNGDGEVDLLLGNWGLNSKFSASVDHPFTLFVNDFDNNKTVDHIYAYYEGDKQYPTALKNDLIKQLPHLKKKFTYFKDYAGKTIQEVFSQEELEKAVKLEVHNFQSVIVLNNGDGSYSISPLPQETQYSPVFDIYEQDFNHDAINEYLFTGNFSGVKPEEGKYTANHGVMLNSDSSGLLEFSGFNIGLNIKGEVRATRSLRTIGEKKLLIIAKNDNELEFYTY
ncbi:VCBS repeat-containing protein [Fulvivirga ulvae]|uniref:VCBS repeat-containing protein n=1 Tax=Fulvivirga ulvae TaxID=2904245 RepID=UPI001F2A8A7C|nr:VCBS repeat-containing protein [Fulvivirga ulvae]UII30792.1 VCBS repeat-containing protein [Fulvivirga ulvae]